MPFTFDSSSAAVRVSGNETGSAYLTWANANRLRALVLGTRTVEALFQIKIQNGAVFDTSDICLMLRHKVEGQANNNTTDTGVWKCHGGMIIVKGITDELPNTGPILDWDGFHILVAKTQGSYAPWNGGARSGSVKNGRIIVQETPKGVDGQIAVGGAAGKVVNVELLNTSGVPGPGMVLGSQDTEEWTQKGTPFTHVDGSLTGFHKKLFFFSDSGEVEINNRRNCGGVVLHNPINLKTGNRARVVRYTSTGATGGGSRSVVVGAYMPKFVDNAHSPIQGVKIAITCLSDGALETSCITGADGAVMIVDGSNDPRLQSYNFSYMIGAATYERKIYDAGVKYIKQAITPAATGPAASVDRGNFQIIQRKVGRMPLEEVQHFHSDYTHRVVLPADPYFTAELTIPSTVRFTSADRHIDLTRYMLGSVTLDMLYDWCVVYLESNLSEPYFLEPSGDHLSLGSWTVIGAEKLKSSDKLISVGSSYPFVANGALANINFRGVVLQDTPTDLDTVSISLDLRYRINADKSVTFVNTKLGGIENAGSGLITINRQNTTIDNSNDKILFFDSTIVVIGADSVTLHQNREDAAAGLNVIASFTSTFAYKYGAAVNHVLMEGRLWLSVNAGGNYLQRAIDLAPGTVSVNLGLQVQIDSLFAQTKADIAATKAGIVAIGRPLQADAYVAPANADIAAIRATTDKLGSAPTATEIRAEIEATGSKLDKAMRAAQNAEDQTL